MRLRLATSLMLLFWMSPGWAQPASDVRVVVDVSGSMSRNDPNRVSDSALELLVALLPSGVRGGLWTFGSDVRNPLPSSTVDAQWRRRALSLKPDLSQYQQFTDIEQAVRQAARAPSSAARRHLIVLTDGVVDVPAPPGEKRQSDADSRQRLLEQEVPRLAEEGVTIHTIAFSSDVDQSLARQMAEKTGGLAAVAETPQALLHAFLDVVDRIFPVDQVPLAAGDFVIDERIASFSALLFHAPGAAPLTLVGPDGQRYSARQHPDEIDWQAQERFDIVTIDAPRAGTWHIEGRIGRQSRINVDSALTLRTGEWPTTLFMDFATPLEAWVETRESVRSAKAELSNIQVRVELKGPEGTVRESVKLRREENRFRGTLPAPDFTGNGQLLLTAEGENFARQRQQAVSVQPAISARLGKRSRQALLHAEHPRINDDNTRVTARLQGETLTVRTVDPQDWRIELPDIDSQVAVPLLLQASITLDGDARRIDLPPLMLNADARIGLGSARLDGGNIAGESLGEPVDEEDESATWVDGFGKSLDRIANALPRFLYRQDGATLSWMAVVIGLFIMLAVALGRRRATRRRRRQHREDPHV